MTKQISFSKALGSGLVSGVFLGFARPQPCKDLNFAMFYSSLSRSEENFKALEALGLNWRACRDEPENGDDVYHPDYICGVAKESLFSAVELSCLEWQEGTLIVGLDRFMASVEPFPYESKIPKQLNLSEVYGSVSGVQQVLQSPAYPSYENPGPETQDDDDYDDDDDEEKYMSLDTSLTEVDGLIVANLWKVWRNTFEYVSSTDAGNLAFKLRVKPTVASVIKHLEAYDDTPDNLIWSQNWDFDSFSDLNKIWNARPFFVFDDD